MTVYNYPPSPFTQASGTALPGSVQNAGMGLGWNIGTGQLALGGLGALANLWNGWQAHGLANRTFNFQRDMANRNLANQISAYNTMLDDKARSRAVAEGQTPGQRDAYIEQHRLR